SGVVQLSDGRILVAEDEETHPFALMDLPGNHVLKTFSPRDLKRALAGFHSLNDLESLTVDSRGHVYTATSFSPTKAGKAKPERELLVRFDVVDDKLSEVRVSSKLKSAL